MYTRRVFHGEVRRSLTSRTDVQLLPRAWCETNRGMNVVDSPRRGVNRAEISTMPGTIP